jgi:hypothetical protein
LQSREIDLIRAMDLIESNKKKNDTFILPGKEDVSMTHHDRAV